MEKEIIKECTKYELLKEQENELKEVKTLKDIMQYTKKYKNATAYIKGSFCNGNIDDYSFFGHVKNGEVYVDKMFNENGEEIEVKVDKSQWKTMKI